MVQPCDYLKQTSLVFQRLWKHLIIKFLSVLFLDRLAVIFLNVRPELTREAVHPCQQVASSLWPVMCATFDNFPSDERVMERCCRTLRFLVRCLGIQSVSLMQPIIERIVNIYQIYSHSCFLYLASVLVRNTCRAQSSPINQVLLPFIQLCGQPIIFALDLLIFLNILEQTKFLALLTKFTVTLKIYHLKPVYIT
jgi:hypothetical protein